MRISADDDPRSNPGTTLLKVQNSVWIVSDIVYSPGVTSFGGRPTDSFAGISCYNITAINRKWMYSNIAKSIYQQYTR